MKHGERPFVDGVSHLDWIHFWPRMWDHSRSVQHRWPGALAPIWLWRVSEAGTRSWGKTDKKTGIVTRISHDINSVITAKKCVFMAGFALVYNNKNKTDKRHKPRNCTLLKQKCVFCYWKYTLSSTVSNFIFSHSKSILRLTSVKSSLFLTI